MTPAEIRAALPAVGGQISLTINAPDQWSNAKPIQLFYSPRGQESVLEHFDDWPEAIGRAWIVAEPLNEKAITARIRELALTMLATGFDGDGSGKVSQDYLIANGFTQAELVAIGHKAGQLCGIITGLDDAETKGREYWIEGIGNA